MVEIHRLKWTRRCIQLPQWSSQPPESSRFALASKTLRTSSRSLRLLRQFISTKSLFFLLFHILSHQSSAIHLVRQRFTICCRRPGLTKLLGSLRKSLLWKQCSLEWGAHFGLPFALSKSLREFGSWSGSWGHSRTKW